MNIPSHILNEQPPAWPEYFQLSDHYLISPWQLRLTDTGKPDGFCTDLCIGSYQSGFRKQAEPLCEAAVDVLASLRL